LLKHRFALIYAILILAAAASSAAADKAKLTSYTEMMDRLTALDAADNTMGYKRLGVFSIGNSVQGRQIPMIVVSDPNAPAGSTAKLFVICRQHGNEPATTEAMLSLTEQLVKGDEKAAEILPRVSFYIVPMMNPDGAERFQRKNAKGADLNRDWLNLSQPETKVVRAAIDSIAPDVVIDQHELSPGNRNSDFVESAGPRSGASPEVAVECQAIQTLVTGMLRTHDIVVKSYKIQDHNPARLAHRYLPIHGNTKTILFETRQAGARQYQLQYRMNLHIVGTMTVAKYLAGQQDELIQRIAQYDAQRKWTLLASRSKKPAARRKK
jgi:hypothetical protein